jgi:hypothetical protein
MASALLSNVLVNEVQSNGKEMTAGSTSAAARAASAASLGWLLKSSNATSEREK